MLLMRDDCGESRRLIQPRRWLSLVSKLETKGAAVKRPLAGTMCAVMKCSPGIRSSTGFPGNGELRETTAFWYRARLRRHHSSN
jgi:hypothetical protein